MEERDYTVRGMTCAHCVRAVEEETATVPGVTRATADLGTGRLTVRGDAWDDQAVAEAVVEAGYELER